MANNFYEKYIGFDPVELNYTRERVIDHLTGHETEKLVERTHEEKEAYKAQKEQEFDSIKNSWERLGIKKCAWERAFDEKGFYKIYRKLIGERLEELSSLDGDIESRMMNVIDDVNKKYKLAGALNFYSVSDNGYFRPENIFRGMKKANLEKMFYKNISMETAGTLARNRLNKATTLNEGVALIQELQKTHNSRSIFFKIFHPFKNADENRLIDEVKAQVMQKFNVSKERLDTKLSKEINPLSLKTASLYKVSDFVNTYCRENSGKKYSQQQIDADRQDVSQRADNDFVESQRDLENYLANEVREPIIVDDARQNDNVERSRESVIEDPKIIEVPNNNK